MSPDPKINPNGEPEPDPSENLAPVPYPDDAPGVKNPETATNGNGSYARAQGHTRGSLPISRAPLSLRQAEQCHPKDLDVMRAREILRRKNEGEPHHLAIWRVIGDGPLSLKRLRRRDKMPNHAVLDRLADNLFARVGQTIREQSIRELTIATAITTRQAHNKLVDILENRNLPQKTMTKGDAVFESVDGALLGEQARTARFFLGTIGISDKPQQATTVNVQNNVQVNVTLEDTLRGLDDISDA